MGMGPQSRTFCGATLAKRRKLAAAKGEKPADPDTGLDQGTHHFVPYIPL